MLSYLYFISYAAFILLLSVFQFSFVWTLPSWAGQLNLVLVLLVFILSLRGIGYALFSGGLAGLVLDIYSFLPFGVFFVTFILTTAILYILAEYFFTNRSLYSFWVLTLFASLLYEFFSKLLYYMTGIWQDDISLFFLEENFWTLSVKGAIMNLIAASILFYVFNVISNRFRATFIDTRGFLRRG